MSTELKIISFIVFAVDAVLVCVLANLVMTLKNVIKREHGDTKSLRAENKERTERMVLTAMFLSFALALKYFSISIPLFGADGLRFSFGGIFTAFPAILFGPLYGGITSALSDILGYIMKPTGDFNIFLTMTAFLGGVIKGLLWMLFARTWKKTTARTVKIIFTAFMALILFFGIFSCVSLNKDGFYNGFIASEKNMTMSRNADYVLMNAEETEAIDVSKLSFPGKIMDKLTATKRNFINKSGVEKRNFDTNAALYINLMCLGLIVVGGLGLIVLGIDFVIALVRKKKGSTTRGEVFTRVLPSLLISGIIVTTINTEIIIKMYGITIPFTYYLIPRVLEEALMCTIQAYFVAVLYEGLKSFKKIKQISK